MTISTPDSTTTWTSRRSSDDVIPTGDLLEVALGPGVGAWFSGARIHDVEDANLAHHRPHVPERLVVARDRVAALTGTDAAGWHLMRQVHGAVVGVVDADVPPGAELREVDVLVTTLVERPLVVLAADCVPVLAAGSRAVAAAHAGWRGVVADVPRALVDALVGLGESPSEIHVVLGPSIGACCYEVGPEVVNAVAAVDPDAIRTTRTGAPSVDLRTAIRTRLAELGVSDVVDAGTDRTERGPVCTVCDPGWFSHRRDPLSGRQAGLIVRRGTRAGSVS